MTDTITTREIATHVGLTRAGVLEAAAKLGVAPVKRGDHTGPSLWLRSDLDTFINRRQIINSRKPPKPPSLKPMPEPVRKLVAAVDSANEIAYDDMSELVEAAAAVKSFYRIEP